MTDSIDRVATSSRLNAHRFRALAGPVTLAIAALAIAIVGGIVTTPMFVTVSNASSFQPLPARVQSQLSAFHLIALAVLCAEVVAIALLLGANKHLGAASDFVRWRSRLTIAGPVVALMVFVGFYLAASYTIAPPAN